MAWFFSTILLGFLAFLATNIDDFLLLVLLFSQAKYRKRHIIIGQYLGFVIIIVLSLPGFLFKWIVPLQLIGFLGLVPFTLGIKDGIQELKKLLQKQNLTDEILYLQPYTSQSFVRTFFGSFIRMLFGSLLNPQVYSVVALTVGNGSDNIATYTPLFASGNLLQMGVLIGVFLLLVGLWCYIAHTLISFPAIACITKRFGYLVLPFIFIGLGIVIMIKAGTFAFLAAYMRIGIFP